MMKLADIKFLKETHEIECKAAQGKDGKGALPKDFWQSYSALANTDGGTIYLGIKEHKKTASFEVLGIKNIEKLKSDLVSIANSKEKVSVNMLQNEHIREELIEGKTVLAVDIRRATRKERPVFLTKLPFGNTYRRLHEADQRQADEDVRRMLADQQYDSLDTRILKGFSLEDLDLASYRAFRQASATRNPTANFETLSDLEFLKQIGGWRMDRETGESGLTVAGLLMFGTYSIIREEFPHYFVDYQERPESKADRRYIDRVCPDFSWSGNLYDFYRKVYPKLVTDIKVGFTVKDGVREDDPPSHVAVREALVNAMVHADYSVSTSLLVVKRPDLLGFKNPGLMRIPFKVAMEGGESDSRNKTLQDMFRMIGAGDRQGFGVRKIIEGWKEFDWRVPQFDEIDGLVPRVLVRLSMLSLFPERAVAYFEKVLTAQWSKATQLEKIALVLAYTEKALSHARLSQFSSEHPRDIGNCLQNLENQGFLASTGSYRAKTYHLPNQEAPSAEDVFDIGAFDPSSQNNDLSSQNNDPSSQNNDPSSQNNDPSSQNNDLSSQNLDELGRIQHAKFPYPFVDELARLKEAFRQELEKIAEQPRRKQRVNPQEMMEVILKLCSEQYLTLAALSQLLSREQETLRGQYISKLKNEGKLEMAFPRTPNDPRQAYITAK